MQRLLSTLPHGIGKTPLSEKEFYSICAAERVKIVWSNFTYYSPEGPYICLDKRLHGIELLFAAYHELAHHFISAGASLDDPDDARDELQANAIALVCIIPKNYLYQIDDILDLAPVRFARRVKRERLALYFLFGV